MSTPVIAEPREHHTLVTPARVLMAPGPTNLPPAVQQSMLAPLVGHKDPAYLRVMDDTAELLRAVFLTQNTVSIALPGTGGAGRPAARRAPLRRAAGQAGRRAPLRPAPAAPAPPGARRSPGASPCSPPCGRRRGGAR